MGSQPLHDLLPLERRPELPRHHGHPLDGLRQCRRHRSLRQLVRRGKRFLCHDGERRGMALFVHGARRNIRNRHLLDDRSRRRRKCQRRTIRPRCRHLPLLGVTMPTIRTRRLRAVISGVAILAVGVTGAILGTAFAAPDTVIAASPTESVPVLAPVGHGPNVPAADSDGDPDTLDVSRAVAEKQMPTGGGSELDPRIENLLDDLLAADDPGSVVDPEAALRLLDPAPGEAADPGGDPCAPVDGEPATDCPAGISGTVLGLRAAPHSDVIGTANPPTYEDSLHKLYYCEPQEHGDTDLPFVAATNIPVTISVSYWPTTDPTAVSRTELTTSAGARSDWERHFEAGDPFGEWTRIQHCTVLEGLEPHVGYRFRLDTVDMMGGEATFSGAFALPDSRTRPPARVVPIGDNMLLLSLPHGESESVQFNAFVTDGEEPDCNSLQTQLGSVTNLSTGDVSAAHLERNGYQERFTKRTSQVFWVPEGSTIAVCLSSYLNDRASYDWARANYRHQETLHSPDRMLPTVTLHDVDLVRTVAADAVTISASTRDNLSCGDGWTGPATQGDEVAASDLRGAVLCSISHFSGLVGLSTSSGDVVVRTFVRQGDDVTSTYSVLPLGRQACRGTCDTPEPSWYRISLSTIQVGDGLCGTSFGECEPPTRAASAGTALLKVEWDQGERNGLTEWGRTAPVSGHPAVLPRPDYPQMDTSQRINVTRVPGLYAADASFLLVTDRPVNYTARLVSGCSLPGAVTEVTGRNESRIMVLFSKLCAGENHLGQVELTDDAGAVTTYNVVPGDNLWAHGAGGVGLPSEPSMLSWSLALSRTERSGYPLSTLRYLGIFVDGTALSDQIPLGCQLDPDVVRTSLLTPDVYLSEVVTVQVSATLSPAVSRSDGYATCRAPHGAGSLSFRIDVPRSDLFGDGVTITAPDGGEYRFALTLRAS